MLPADIAGAACIKPGTQTSTGTYRIEYCYSSVKAILTKEITHGRDIPQTYCHGLRGYVRSTLPLTNCAIVWAPASDFPLLDIR